MGTVIWTIFSSVILLTSMAWLALRCLSPEHDHSSPIIIALTSLITLLPLPLAVMAVLSVLLSAPTGVGVVQCVLFAVLAVVSFIPTVGYFLPVPDFLNRALGMPVHRSTLVHHSWWWSRRHPDGEPRVRVMTLNTRFGKADARAIVKTVKRRGVDVLALQEVSSDLLERLKEAGMETVMPVRVVGDPSDKDNGGVNAVYARAGMDARPWHPGLDIKAAHPVAVGLHVEETGVAADVKRDDSAAAAEERSHKARRVRVISIHTASPQRGAARWGDGLEELGKMARSYTPGGIAPTCPLIIAGDFNATCAHPSFRAMLHTGALVDCSYERHHGVHVSFPASWGVIPPLLELDHILHTAGIETMHVKTVHIPGTDHMAQIAELRFPGA